MRRTSPEDLNADFVSTGRGDVNLLNFERLGWAPAHGSFAPDSLTSGIGHGGDSRKEEKTVGDL